MEKLLEFKINQILTKGPLLWLWLLLGVIGIVGIGLLISWFFGRPVIKFYIDNKVENIVPIKRNEQISIPIELSEYVWFEDRALTKTVDITKHVKHRIIRFYTNSKNIVEGLG